MYGTLVDAIVELVVSGIPETVYGVSANVETFSVSPLFVLLDVSLNDLLPTTNDFLSLEVS